MQRVEFSQALNYLLCVGYETMRVNRGRTQIKDTLHVSQLQNSDHWACVCNLAVILSYYLYTVQP